VFEKKIARLTHSMVRGLPKEAVDHAWDSATHAGSSGLRARSSQRAARFSSVPPTRACPTRMLFPVGSARAYRSTRRA